MLNTWRRYIKKEMALVYTLSVIASLIFINNAASEPMEHPCISNYPTMKTLDITKYSGEWYEYLTRGSFLPNSTLFRCGLSTYTKVDDYTINGFRTEVGPDDKIRAVHASLKLENPSNQAKFLLTIPSMGFKGPYWVVSTDYSYYTIYVSCNENAAFPTVSTFVYTRSPIPSKQTVTAIRKAVRQNGLHWSTIRDQITNQIDCPNYP